jgi:hypothetical protein
MTSRAPLILAIVLLLLPVLYVGSYFALVVPSGIPRRMAGPYGGTYISFNEHYRFADTEAKFLFWPLEQIDRRMRPKAWQVDDLIQRLWDANKQLP